MRHFGFFAALVLAGCHPAPAPVSESPHAAPADAAPVVAADPPPPAAESGPAQGQPCDQGKCGPKLTCVEYYGVAGARGPKLSSCEIPCPSGKCPAGQACTVIADGPGRVCRPR
jgi:hypothetical protein